MNRASLYASGAIVLLANALALGHALRNRLGAPEADVTLTERELRYAPRFTSGDDSGVMLNLLWMDPNTLPWPDNVQNPPIWLNRQKLETLGLDCSVDPTSADAAEHYRRQRSRNVFAALELNGAVGQAWLDTYERSLADQSKLPLLTFSREEDRLLSHLFTIDADLDARKLRERHPDRSSVIILPAVVEVSLEPFPYPGMQPDLKQRVRVIGHIAKLPASIHVPLPFRNELPAMDERRNRGENNPAKYRVHLRYGALLEPWVTGVERR